MPYHTHSYFMTCRCLLTGAATVRSAQLCVEANATSGISLCETVTPLLAGVLYWVHTTIVYGIGSIHQPGPDKVCGLFIMGIHVTFATCQLSGGVIGKEATETWWGGSKVSSEKQHKQFYSWYRFIAFYIHKSANYDTLRHFCFGGKPGIFYTQCMRARKRLSVVQQLALTSSPSVRWYAVDGDHSVVNGAKFGKLQLNSHSSGKNNLKKRAKGEI